MKKIFLKFALLFLALVIINDSFAQKRVIPKRLATRNVVWFSPTRANTINGLALSSFSSDMWYENESLKINGINIEANPASFIVLPYAIVGSIEMLFSKNDSTRRRSILSVPDSNYLSKNFMNGISIGVLGSFSNNNGLTIAGIMNNGGKLNGIALGGIANSYYSFKGIAIAGLANNFYKGRGIQIGLFNRCVDCKGLQIGLLNKIGNRTLPFLNLRL
ncbi:MAG: hypothetical protein KA319_07790 [Ferruginibacter sp.]|nr:hypothetical protein [Ferruginibacter sp.]